MALGRKMDRTLRVADRPGGRPALDGTFVARTSPPVPLGCFLRGAAIVLVAGFAPMVQAQPDTATGAASGPNEAMVSLPSWSPMVKRVLPAVVNVSAEIPPEAAIVSGAAPGEDGAPQASPAESSLYDYLRRYFEQRGLPADTPVPPGTRMSGGKIMSVGSAFVIDPSGYVVTNNHVIARATKITITFSDNTQHLADLVGSDPKTDIALLKVSVKHSLPFLQWGDSDAVEVGDWVMTVGNPFGLGGTVTAGIVSALGRYLQQGPFDDFLQIDAPINRGSSGGPTFDTAGHVVGINTAIFSPSGGSIGIGFAIPSSIAKVIVQKLRDTGHADHGYLGVTIQSISPEIARALHMDPEMPIGLLVNEVSPDGPAAKAGVQPGDVIREIDGHTVQMPQDISKFVLTAKIGDRLRMTLERNGETRKSEIVVTHQPTPKQLAALAREQGGGMAEAETVRGIWFANLTPDLRRELHLPASVQGAVIGGIDVKSGASAIGLVPGDVVMSIDRHPVAGPAEAMQKLRSGERDVLMLVNRHGSSQFMVLPGQGKDGHE